MAFKTRNRIKLILVENSKISKLFVENLVKYNSTVSVWFKNRIQPPIGTSSENVKLLDSGIKESLTLAKK